MRVQSIENRKAALAVATSFIPDLVVSVIAASILAGPYDSWWGIFFAWLIGIQIVSILLWTKNSIWLWVHYKIWNKKIMQASCLEFFQKNKLPEPNEYEDSAGDYLWRISSDKNEDSDKRVSATIMYTLFDGLSVQGLIQRKIQMAMAIDEALLEYKKTFLHQPENNNPENEPAQSELSEDEENRQASLVQKITIKCKFAENNLTGMDGSSGELDRLYTEDYNKIIEDCLQKVGEINDDFYKSAGLHPIVETLIKAGDYQRAEQLINSMAVDFIQEKAANSLKKARAA